MIQGDGIGKILSIGLLLGILCMLGYGLIKKNTNLLSYVPPRTISSSRIKIRNPQVGEFVFEVELDSTGLSYGRKRGVSIDEFRSDVEKLSVEYHVFVSINITPPVRLSKLVKYIDKLDQLAIQGVSINQPTGSTKMGKQDVR